MPSRDGGVDHFAGAEALGSEAFERSSLRPVGFHIVDEEDVNRWFSEYLDAFAACGRGERDTSSLLAYYGVPLLLSTDDGFLTLSSEAAVVAAVQRQVDGMGAADYASSEVLDSQVSVLNDVSALYRGTFSRWRRDASEIGRLDATYLVADHGHGRRINALVVHSPVPGRDPAASTSQPSERSDLHARRQRLA